MQNKSTIGYLTKQYRSILKKCFLISVGAYALLGASSANATDFEAMRGEGGVRTYTQTGDDILESTGSSTGTFNVIGNLKNALNIGSSGNLIVDASNATSGENVYKLDGQGSYNLTNPNKGLLYLSNIVMTNGYNNYGGGLYNDSSSSSQVNITNSSFISNTTPGNGGAISTGAGVLTISASSFIKNDATARGGAISNGNSTTNIDGSVFHLNTADTGGAIANRGALSVKSSTFSSNSAKSGGAIVQYLQGATPPLTATIVDTTFSDNSATVYGGAIYNNSGTLTITNGSFINNYVTGSSTGSAGGAIFNASNATLTIDGTNFSENKRLGVTAAYGTGTGGGAIANQGTANISNATFTNNSSAQRGGAVHNYLGNITINNTTFTENSTQWGGAFYNGGIQVGSTLGTATIKDSYFNDNIGTSGGGAIYSSLNSKITLTNTSFSDNTSPIGGAIYNHYASSSLTVKGGSFTNNSATGNPSGSIGGAINSGGLLKIDGTIFTDNKVDASNIAKNVQGGALRIAKEDEIEGATIIAEIINATFDGNTATGTSTAGQGGAIFNYTTTTITDSVFKNNAAQSTTGNGRGGAIENGQELTITNTTFTDNKSEGFRAYGGAIYNTGSLYINATDGKTTTFSGNLENGVSNAIQNTNNAYFNSDEKSSINFYDRLSGSGTYYLQSGNLNLLGENGYFISGTNLEVAGGKISTVDNEIRVTNLGDLVLKSNLYYGLDVNLEDGTGDSITTQSFATNSNKIIINEINIIKDGTLDVKLSNSAAIRNVIMLDASPIISEIASVTKSYNVISYDAATGILDFEETSLKTAVNSTLTQRIYAMNEDEVVKETIGNMGGKILDISGLNATGTNYAITANPTGLGGIITSAGQTLNISDVSKISGFATTGDGGFINNSANLNIDNVVFENNNANSASVQTSTGGAINNNAGSLNIEGSTFNSNTSTYAGGAVAIFGGSITNIIADFTENGVISIDRALGGAIYLNQNAEKIEGTFKENYVTSTGGYDVVGGAIAIMTGTIKSLTADFLDNYVSSTGSGYAGGGAIRTYTGAEINILDSQFIGNYVESNSTIAAGGAIFSHVSSTAIGTSWDATNGATTNVTDSNFFDNYVKTTSGAAQGGAVYLETVSDTLNVNAKNDDVYFSGNYTQVGTAEKDFNAIHLLAGKLNLATTGDNQIIFNDAITAERAESAITIAGNVVFNDVVSNTSISLNSGQIDINQYNTYNEAGYTGVGAHELEFATNIFDNVNLTMASNTVLNAMNNSATDALNFEKLTISGSAKISIDASLKTGEVDTINANSSSGTLVLDTVKLLTDSTQKTVELDITDSNISININALVLDTSAVNGYYKYRDYSALTGILTIGRLNLAEVVALNEADKTYTLIEDEIVAQNLGSLVNNKLSIIGTGTDYIIDGQKLYNGITVGANKELNVTDVKNVTGFISSASNSDLGSFIINSGTTNITNSAFSGNSASYADGVIRNQGTISIANSTFTYNFGGTAGSAVLSNTGTATITNSTLSNNTKNTIGNTGTVNIFGSTFASNTNNLTATNNTGGAINNYSGGVLNINKGSNLTTLFDSNTGTYGGAIRNNSTSASTINNTTFDGNSAQKGGAIYNTGTIAEITNATFENNQNNHNTYAQGGAIYNEGGGNIKKLDADFTSNLSKSTTVSGAGGAIFNRTKISNITGDFTSNKAQSTAADAYGGAIYNTTLNSSVAANLIDGITGNFTSNNAEAITVASGGAIYNRDGTINNIIGDFASNSASASTAQGGAIANTGIMNLFDSSFTNNNVTGATLAQGGAIYNTGTISITAQTEDVVFSGNKSNGISDAIYNEGEVNFNSQTNYNITSFDDFLGDGTYNLQTGKLLLNGANFATNSNFVLFDDTMLSTVNNTISNTNVGNLTVDDIANWGLDINISNNTSDTLIGNITSGAEKFLISELNVMGNASSVPTINITDDANLTKALALASSINVHTQEEVLDSLIMSYNDTTGELLFEIADINDAFSLDIDEKVFVMGSAADGRTVTKALGALNGDWLSISGNNYDIIGNNQSGGSVANDQILTLTDVKSIDGFDGSFINNSGDLNIKADYYNTTLGAQADINNNFGGVLNLITALDKNIILNNDISGMGIININGNIFANGKISDNNISINSGVLNVGTTAEFSGVNLNANGGAINLINNNIQNLTFGTISTSASALNLDIDVKLSNQTADMITASKSGDNKVYISKLNILDDATQIESIVQIADGTIKNNISLEGVDIIAPTSSTEDYENGYFVGYSTSSGKITFSYANIETAFSSSVEEKAYSMAQDDELVTTALTLNGDSLSIDGNGLSINASDINVNNKSLTITDVTLNSTLSGVGNVNFDRDVTLNSDVSAFGGVANLNGGTLSLGKDAVLFANEFNISNTPTLNLQNGETGIYNAQNWNLNSNLNVMIDVDLIDKQADSIINFADESNAINISSIYLTSETQGQTTVSVTDGKGGGNFTISSDQLKIVDEIYQYQYNVDDTKLATDGLLTFVDTEYKDFNPAIVDSIVAKQSQYLSSISIYKEAFANFGTQNPMTYKNMPSGDFMNPKQMWFRPFGKNEDVNLDNGYVVDNEAYGALFGVDSDIKLMGDCWLGMYSLYGGYVNSTQKYEDVKIEQDSFVFGARALFEKDEFFTGLTANISTSFADGNNMFGKEDFVMYSTGIASKSGYNFGFEHNKYIIQPSIMMSYTFIHTPSYDNSAGVKISDQNLNAFQITPEVKFIKNLESNRQVYVGASYNWNIIDSSKVTANDVALPDVAVDPYAEFRIGTSRKFEDELDTFVEITASSGGREGFGIEAGIKWNF